MQSELEPTADTYLRNGSKNKNYGDELTTWIRGSGKRSTLLTFDQQAIENAVGTVGTWELRADLDDGRSYSVEISVRD